MTVTGLVGIETTSPHNIQVIDSLVSGVVQEVTQFGTQTDCVMGKDDINAQEVSTMNIPPQPGGEQMQVYSTSIEDKPGGMGIASVMIHYLDSAGNQQTEVVTLNGTTPVMTVAKDMRFINEVHSETPGTPGGNEISAAGVIRVCSSANALLEYNVIPSGLNIDNSLQFMVPVNMILAIEEYEFSATKKSIEIWLRSTDDEGILKPYGIWILRKSAVLMNSTIAKANLADPIFVAPLSIVKATAFSKEAGGDANVSWSGVLIPTTRLSI